MFDTLFDLIQSLHNDTDFKIYNNTKNTRKVLKTIRDEAQKLRLKTMEEYYKLNPGRKKV